MKVLSFILIFSVGFLNFESTVNSIYSSLTVEETSCCSSDEESCCTNEEASDCGDTHEKDGNCCNDGCCSYGGSCNCCCVCKTQEPYALKSYFTSNTINSISDPIGISDFNSTCFQPPEVV